MSVRYSKEFKSDVVRIALAREKGTTLAQIAGDFGIHEVRLYSWIRSYRDQESQDGALSSEEKKELAATKQRILLLEQENEILRRAAAYLSQANLPAK